MGPTENPTSHFEDQQTGRRNRLARRPRTRRCLLKGCELSFRPRHARQRYCSNYCRAAARQWSQWKAQKNIGLRLRPARIGKSKAAAIGIASEPGNHRKKTSFQRPRGSSLENIFFDACCDRPGCYEGFVRQPRSPLQRFCTHACRRAMERVWERERRWQRGAPGARAG